MEDAARFSVRRLARGGMTEALALHNGELIGGGGIMKLMPAGRVSRRKRLRFFAPVFFVAQREIMRAQNRASAKTMTQIIDNRGQASLRFVFASQDIEGERSAKASVINVGKFQ